MFTYQSEVSKDADQPDWDKFLGKVSGGHYVQTSWWAQVKAQRGTKAVRLVIKQQEKVVAGAQILIKTLPAIGAIGYVPKGPVLAMNDPNLVKYLIDQIHQLARSYHIQYLIVQPHEHCDGISQHLLNDGFCSSSTEIAPTATIQIDLRQDIDQLMAGMKKKTRRYLRLCQREGLVGRQGTKDDISVFYNLLIASSQRQGFTPFPESYFTELWSLLQPRGHVALFLVEHAGEPVSAQVVVAFGDTVVGMNSGWFGTYARFGPNYMLDWTTIEWAKSQGYHYYDLGGFERKEAKALLQNKIQPGPDTIKINSYKLKLGGQIKLYSRAYGYVYNPILRWGYTNIFNKIENWQPTQKVLNLFR